MQIFTILHYIATSGATSRSCARGCSSPGSRWTATNVSSNSAAVSNAHTLEFLNFDIDNFTYSTCHYFQSATTTARCGWAGSSATTRGTSACCSSARCSGSSSRGRGSTQGHPVSKAYTGSSWESGNVKIIINVRNWIRRYIAMYLLMLLHF